MSFGLNPSITEVTTAAVINNNILICPKNSKLNNNAPINPKKKKAILPSTVLSENI